MPVVILRSPVSVCALEQTNGLTLVRILTMKGSLISLIVYLNEHFEVCVISKEKALSA